MCGCVTDSPRARVQRWTAPCARATWGSRRTSSPSPRTAARRSCSRSVRRMRAGRVREALQEERRASTPHACDGRAARSLAPQHERQGRCKLPRVQQPGGRLRGVSAGQPPQRVGDCQVLTCSVCSACSSLAPTWLCGGGGQGHASLAGGALTADPCPGRPTWTIVHDPQELRVAKPLSVACTAAGGGAARWNCATYPRWRRCCWPSPGRERRRSGSSAAAS